MLFLNPQLAPTEAILEEIEQIIAKDSVNVRAKLRLYSNLARDTKLSQLEAELLENKKNIEKTIEQIRREFGGQRRTKDEQTLKTMIGRAGPRQKRKLESLYGKVAHRLTLELKKEREVTADLYKKASQIESAILDNQVHRAQLKAREEAARAHMSALEYLTL